MQITGFFGGEEGEFTFRVCVCIFVWVSPTGRSAALYPLPLLSTCLKNATYSTVSVNFKLHKDFTPFTEVIEQQGIELLT